MKVVSKLLAMEKCVLVGFCSSLQETYNAQTASIRHGGRKLGITDLVQLV